MIKFLAGIFRGIHLILGITPPPAESDERSFVLIWLGVIVSGVVFFAFLFYFLGRVLKL